MKAKQTQPPQEAQEPRPANFEAALNRLETVVGEMEGGALNLEETIARFEEGQKLVEFCTGKLNEVERKIEILMKKGERMEPQPFGEDVAEDSVP
jgi:exodeoxyribonuclease VII small subunit